jgi:hypothetical protein
MSRAANKIGKFSEPISEGVSAFMRKIAILICLLALPSVSRADSKQASWTNLTNLHTGQKIQIIQTDSKKFSGTFVSFTDTAISYHDASGDQTIQKLNVRSVKLMQNKHRLRNTLIVAGVGAGIGAASGAAAYKACPPEGFCIGPPHPKAVEVGVFGIIGLLGGAAVGALLPTHETIYDVGSH